MTKYENFIRNLGIFSLVAFIITFPFNFQTCKYFQCGVLAAGLLNPLLWKNLPLTKFKKEEKVLISITGLYLAWEIITLAWSENLSKGFKEIVSSLPILLFPLLLTFFRIGKIIGGDINKYLKLLSISILVSSVVCLAWSLGNCFHEVDGQTFFDIRPQEYRDRGLFECITAGYSYISYNELSHFVRPHYLSMALTLVIILTYKWIYSDAPSTKKKIIGIAIFLYSIAFIFMLNSRTSFIALAILLAMILYQEIFSRRHIALSVTIIAASLVLGVMIFKSERVQQIVESYNSRQNGDTEAELNTRESIWKGSIDVIKKYPVFGTGIGDAKDNILGQFLINKDFYCYEKNYDSHNQFLDSWLGKGLVGLAITAAFFLIPMYFGAKKRDFLLWGFFVIILTNNITETNLTRYWSLVFIVLAMWLLLVRRHPDENEQQ